MNFKNISSAHDFISSLSFLLKKRKDADSELINILEENILKSNISSDALDESLKKIIELAGNRAKRTISNKSNE